MLITKSPITHQDEPFLFALYSETRADELKIAPWDDERKDAFLRRQFQLQHRHYTSNYKNAFFQIIKLGEKPIGRLYVAELDDEIRIIDLTILTEFRGKNVGTNLIEEILRDADKKNKNVQIYLETNNQSTHLFARLGFAAVADDGVYRLWRKSANSKTSAAEV
jgi:N-acetylglutamate synthase-like GNAT family acetyltransferase